MVRYLFGIVHKHKNTLAYSAHNFFLSQYKEFCQMGFHAGQQDMNRFNIIYRESISNLIFNSM